MAENAWIKDKDCNNLQSYVWVFISRITIKGKMKTIHENNWERTINGKEREREREREREGERDLQSINFSLSHRLQRDLEILGMALSWTIEKFQLIKNVFKRNNKKFGKSIV